ncbi:MAG: aromatic ring-hydroxylating dioxygenase subunit alpha [Leptolyngbya sp.]|nr:aromatic ring-hydroxylating dioxygenase subunit alpha [Candidatus Melainabacteria bacterium]
MEFYKGWYAAISSSEIIRGKPTAIKRFGQDLVAWRNTDGKPVIMKDSCPHRSVKLSLGTIKEGNIRCAFHGFEFDNVGSCTLVPETAKPAPNLKCSVIKSSESHGLIWLWHGPEGEATEKPEWFEELNDDFAWSQYSSQFPCHITRCIENQLDYAHLPFIHATTIGGNFDLNGIDSNFELDDKTIKLQLKTGYFKFKFPNIWTLQILPERFHQFIAFVPVDAQNTLLYVRAYQKFSTFPGIRQMLGLILNIQSQQILQQDRRVVLSHPAYSSSLAEHEKLYPSDQGIAWFRKRWAEVTGDDIK